MHNFGSSRKSNYIYSAHRFNTYYRAILTEPFTYLYMKKGLLDTKCRSNELLSLLHDPSNRPIFKHIPPPGMFYNYSENTTLWYVCLLNFDKCLMTPYWGSNMSTSEHLIWHSIFIHIHLIFFFFRTFIRGRRTLSGKIVADQQAILVTLRLRAPVTMAFIEGEVKRQGDFESDMYVLNAQFHRILDSAATSGNYTFIK